MNTDFILRKPCSNKTMGIEIECLLPFDYDITTYTHDSFFYVATDGSIREHWGITKGVEFVSQPLSKDFLKKALKKLYAKHGEHLSVNGSCGIHVHVSRKWLSEDKAKAIYGFIQTLSDTDCSNLFGRAPNTYCDSTVKYGVTRYCAVNNQNKATIEFRVFSSGNLGWAQWCVDVVAYMIENAYTLNVDAMYAFYDLKHGSKP